MRAVALVSLFFLALAPLAQADDPASMRERLGAWLQAAKEKPDRDAALAAQAFYAKREFKPFWYEGGRLSPRARSLLAALGKADEHGLKPQNYAMPALADLAGRAAGNDIADAEIRLMRNFLEFAGDVAAGRIQKPRQVGGIFREPKRPDSAALIDGAARTENIVAYVDSLPPDNARYLALKKGLALYRELEAKGGWPRVTDGPPLKPGAKDRRIAEVRKRLIVTGELKAASVADPELYDDELVKAVKVFQDRHGLKDDGAIGRGTMAELNVTARERVEQIVINLERRRWMQGHLGDRYIYVNIADNDLKVVEKGKTIYTARVVVGRPYHETPVFSAVMTYIEFNPWWNVPHSIAAQEMLPVIKKVPGYLESNDYLLLTRMGDNSSAINSASVDWSTITERNFPFFIRQKPGPRNALGTTLFMFPNVHNVFIHDTPMRSIFNLEDRYFSHGCVRVENPWALMMLLLKDRKDWNEDRIKDVIAKREPVRLNLADAEKITVHINYLTAWAERDGAVHFRKDVYRRDANLKRHFDLAQGGNPPPPVKPAPRPAVEKKG